MKDGLKILIFNDDGIDSPGIERLAHIAADLGRVWVFAPSGQCSAMSQRLTIWGDLTVEKRDFPAPVEAAYSVGGTPADCVKAALTAVMDERPDVVFSGINNAYNAGHDICYSGTVGAAMEALLNGIPAMAFSAQNDVDYTVVDKYLPGIIRELLDKPASLSELWNVNFPCCPLAELKGILRDRTPAPLPLYRNSYTVEQLDGGRLRLAPGFKVTTTPAPAGSDIDALQNNYISIGKIKALLSR